MDFMKAFDKVPHERLLRKVEAFFTVRVGQVWNKLPEEVVMAKDVNAFKRLLDKHWKDHPCRYDHKIDPYDLLAS